jgi:hypothetical protein
MAMRVQHQKKRRRRWIVIVVVLVALVWGLNYFMISRPIAAALAADGRSAGIGLTGHLRYYVDPTTLALDLGRVQVADTTDVFRALLMVAKGLSDASWGIPGAVALSRDGNPVYTIAGGALRQMAHDYPLARKPAVVLLALVQALRRPDGKDLGPEATVESAARGWVTGHP